eukprot:m.467630 g.467630  ORF g.467630 m.467630 type:complete len:71 (+) comp26607_c0_seq1:1522-1734(+)
MPGVIGPPINGRTSTWHGEIAATVGVSLNAHRLPPNIPVLSDLEEYQALGKEIDSNPAGVVAGWHSGGLI